MCLYVGGVLCHSSNADWISCFIHVADVKSYFKTAVSVHVHEWHAGESTT
jgi:hypothetical protein